MCCCLPGSWGGRRSFIFVGPSMRAVTLGSPRVMAVGLGSPGLHQLSAAVASPNDQLGRRDGEGG
jgi:hypothetical protein